MRGESLTWYRPPRPISEGELAAFERAVGYKMPDDYRAFALQYSGGRPNETDFVFHDSNGRLFNGSIGEFLSPGLEDKRYILDMMNRTEFFPPFLVPVAIGGGGDYVALDYRGSAPTVVFWHHDRRGDSDEISRIATTFGEFLAMLKVPE